MNAKIGASLSVFSNSFPIPGLPFHLLTADGHTRGLTLPRTGTHPQVLGMYKETFPSVGCTSWCAITFPSSLIVVPPSAPLCRIQGSLDVGSDITLTCSSEEGIPRPTYLWEKMNNIPKLPPTATQGAYPAVYPPFPKGSCFDFPLRLQQ